MFVCVLLFTVTNLIEFEQRSVMKFVTKEVNTPKAINDRMSAVYD